MTFRRDWTPLGEAAYARDANAARRIERVLGSLDWDDGRYTASLIASDASWVTEARMAYKTFDVGSPQRFAFSDALKPHRLYGIESQEVNGIVRYYVLNMHGEMFIVCADFYPNSLGEAFPETTL